MIAISPAQLLKRRPPPLGLRCWPVPLSDGRTAVLTRNTQSNAPGSRSDGEYFSNGRFTLARSADPRQPDVVRVAPIVAQAAEEAEEIIFVPPTVGLTASPSDITSGFIDIFWNINGGLPDALYGAGHTFYLTITVNGVSVLAQSVAVDELGHIFHDMGGTGIATEVIATLYANSGLGSTFDQKIVNLTS